MHCIYQNFDNIYWHNLNTKCNIPFCSKCSSLEKTGAYGVVQSVRMKYKALRKDTALAISVRTFSLSFVFLGIDAQKLIILLKFVDLA